MKEQMKSDAEKRVKTNLTLEAIVNNEELEVTEEDIDKEIDKMAEMYNMEKDQIIGMLGGNKDVLKEDLKMQKAIDFLVEESKARSEERRVGKERGGQGGRGEERQQADHTSEG